MKSVALRNQMSISVYLISHIFFIPTYCVSFQNLLRVLLFNLLRSGNFMYHLP